MSIPQHKNPCTGDHEIYNFGKLFLGRHYILFSLSYQCLGEEKKILKEIMNFNYKMLWLRPITRSPVPGVMKFLQTLPWSSLLLFSLSDLCIGENAFSLSDIYGLALVREPLNQKVQQQTLPESSLLITVCLNHTLEQRRRFFLKIHKLNFFNYLKIIPPPLGCRGHEIYNFLSHNPKDVTY